ncbi:MAG: DUF1993 family protein, partial [Alphaproteobacteria bacterium]
MTVSLYQASVPVFTQILTALSACLKKGEAHAEAKKFDPAVLIEARLAPDMFPLVRQIQIATDMAKGACARLAGAEVPSWADNEKSFAEIHARIKKAVDYAAGFKAERFAGAEDRDITLTIGGEKMTFKGADYLFHFVHPNFYFHAT